MTGGATTGAVLVMLFGALAASGVVLLVMAVRPQEPAPARVRRPVGLRRLLQRAGRRGPLTLGAGLAALLVTRWPVAGLAGAALVLAGPALFGGARSEKLAAARIEAVAVWTESLRDTIAGAVGLEQAILATASTPPPAISAEVRALAARLRVRTPLGPALRRLADDLDDPSADLIVATLILNARLRGPGLRDVLTSLATSAREELEMRGRVGAGRASTRRSVQIVVGVTVVFVFGLVRFNPGYVEPYGSTTGQLVLAMVITLFAAGFWWLRRLSAFDLPDRFLAGPGTPAGGGSTGTSGAAAGVSGAGASGAGWEAR